MQEPYNQRDWFCFTVVYRWTPGGAAPGTSNLWATSLLDLHVPVGAAIFCEGREAAKGEAVEEDL